MLSLNEEPLTGAPMKGHQRFEPYTDNGGSMVGIGGDGFAVLAADTRLTNGYSIFSREQSKITKLNSTTLFGSCGCWCDCLTFAKGLHFRLQYYLYENNKPISTCATAQLVSNMLYQKRFFPYYVNNMVVGLDANNQGVVYSYDPVGSTEQLQYGTKGVAAPILQPFLDCLLKHDNQTIISEDMAKLTKEKVVTYVKDAFLSAAELEIGCGDGLEIVVVTPQGIEEELFQLRKD